MPLDWLLSSGLVIKVSKTELPQPPLKAYEDDGIFKIYLSDCGLLSFLSNLQYKSLMATEDNIYKDSVAENYVVQELRCWNRQLFYFKPDESMKIDILLETAQNIIPVEIRSGRHKCSTSLKNYNEKYKP